MTEVRKPPPTVVSDTVVDATVRRLAEQEEFRSVCGHRRDLVGPGEDPRVCFHYMRIFDSRKHVHQLTTEYYFIVDGEGEVELNDTVIPVTKGDMVVITPGVWHTSRPAPDSELHVLLIAVPSPVLDGPPDVQYDHEFAD